MIERAIVLAAGFGKRVQPLTNVTPKPLLKIYPYNKVDAQENAASLIQQYGKD